MPGNQGLYSVPYSQYEASVSFSRPSMPVSTTTGPTAIAPWGKPAALTSGIMLLHNIRFTFDAENFWPCGVILLTKVERFR